MRQASGALITHQPATHAAIQINEGPSWRQSEFTQQEAEPGSRDGGDGDGGDRDGGTGMGGPAVTLSLGIMVHAAGLEDAGRKMGVKYPTVAKNRCIGGKRGAFGVQSHGLMQ